MEAAKEALWLRSMLAQLFTPLDTPTTLLGPPSPLPKFVNNQYHTRTKHIDICFHFIRWVVAIYTVLLKVIHSPSRCHLQSTTSLPHSGFAWGGGASRLFKNINETPWKKGLESLVAFQDDAPIIQWLYAFNPFPMWSREVGKMNGDNGRKVGVLSASIHPTNSLVRGTL
ncbi:hypothetical protein C8J57DRAFT_1664510 [Mycena rebaudengoi]|nr:hypothetical protein C8J57DRAFT_1664510 [Mycena rebaudengoi]